MHRCFYVGYIDQQLHKDDHDQSRSKHVGVMTNCV